jgi:hypothetical protein
MLADDMTLSDREVATLFWLAVLAVYSGRSAAVRSSIAAAVRAFWGKAGVIFALFYAWMAVIVVAMWRVGLWQPAMLKDTLLWAIAGAALIVNSINESKEPGFFRRRIGDAIGLAAAVEFYVNLGNLGLIGELIAQPLLTFAILVPIVLKPSKVNNPTLHLATVVRAVIVLVLLAPPAIHLINDRASIDWAETGRDFVLPIWLTVWALVFVYFLSVMSGYEQLLLHMYFANDRRGAPLKVKAAVVSKFGLGNRGVNQFAGDWPRRLVKANGFKAARKIIDDWRKETAAADAAVKKEAADLVKYAGVKGTDERGRQLDRREFKETANALEWLHTMEQGWFNQDGRYRDDLADQFSDTWSRRGLPEDHRIKVKVSRSGQSWFGWRRTPSGWYFGIGASAELRDEWYYDGPEAPASFPASGRGHGWADEPYTETVNLAELRGSRR